MTGIKNHAAICVLLSIAIYLSACGDDQAKPTAGVVGKPADSLEGVWSVTDSWLGCSAFDIPRPMGVTVDTICPGTLNYKEEVVSRAQEKLMRFYQTEDFPVEIDYCTGIISDTLIDVFCRGKGRLFPELCATPVSFHAVGRPDPEEWTLVEVIEFKFVGDTCDLDPGQIFTMCMRLISVNTRVDDPPSLCE